MRLGNPSAKIEIICWPAYPRDEPSKEGIKYPQSQEKKASKENFCEFQSLQLWFSSEQARRSCRIKVKKYWKNQLYRFGTRNLQLINLLLLFKIECHLYDQQNYLNRIFTAPD